MTTEADMDKAAGMLERAASGAATCVHEDSQGSLYGSARNEESPEKQGVLVICGNLCETTETPLMGVAGLEPATPTV